MGFSLEDKFLKRAGLDYWQFIDLKLHENWQDLTEFLGKNQKYWFFSKRAQKLHWEANFKSTDALVFGAETHGLKTLENININNYTQDNCLRIPMENSEIVRSLNLSSSVAVAYYEACRQVSV